MLKHMMDAVTEIYPQIPVCVHLDHGNGPDTCMTAIQAGFTSVMMDGSLKADGKSPADWTYNVGVTKTVTDMAHLGGISVEGELGVLGSLETGMGDKEDGHGAEGKLSHDQLLTNPDEAVKFVQETRVDALAIAMGTSHGAYKFTRKPDGDILAMNVIEEIHRKLPNTHLVMHGSSSVPQDLQEIINANGGKMKATWGVPVSEIQRGIKNGVRKINIDTDNRMAMTGQIRKVLHENPEEFDPRKYLKPAMGQNLYQDIQREFADENQLQRDVRRYQHDIATGHYLRAAADRARIQNDETNIRYDQSLVQNDLAYQGGIRPNTYQTQSLVSHPQYPGYYYYPSQPAQLYYYPTSQPIQPQVPAAATFVGPPSPASLANVAPVNVPSSMAPSANPVTFNVAPPSKTIAVLISNPAETGVPINFVVDGTAYSVPSGYTQKLVATTSSVVEFDRGDLLGDGRYGLTEGPYEFRYADKGWELYKLPAKPPVPSTTSTSSLPRNAPPRSIASTSAVPSPTIEGQSATREIVPPPPVPDSTPPR